jgi:hypothetical protein
MMFRSLLRGVTVALTRPVVRPPRGARRPAESPDWVQQPEIRKKVRPARYLGLRPPTLMIDLLFGALMLFAFHMGDPNARAVVRHDVDLPSSSKAADGKETKLMALVPVKVGNGWMYELNNRTRVDAKTALNIARQEKSRLVLIIAAETPVQSYLNAEMPFRKLGAKVGLAVRQEGNRK